MLCNIYARLVMETGVILLTGRVESRFLRSPNVFISTFKSESDNNRKSCSVLKLAKYLLLFFVQPEMPYSGRIKAVSRITLHLLY